MTPKVVEKEGGSNRWIWIIAVIVILRIIRTIVNNN